MIYLYKYEEFITEVQNPAMTTIQSFGQGTPSGLAGVTDPNMKSIEPDDKLEVQYKRDVDDLKQNYNTENPIMWTKTKRKWRNRRENIRNMKKK